MGSHCLVTLFDNSCVRARAHFESIGFSKFERQIVLWNGSVELTSSEEEDEEEVN